MLSELDKALFRIAKEFWFLVPPWWDVGEIVATIKKDGIGLLLRSVDYPDRPLPSHALAKHIEEFLAEGLRHRRPAQIVFRIRGSNPPRAEIVQVSDVVDDEGNGWVPTCQVAPTPAAGWEEEFLAIHSSEHFHRLTAPSTTDGFLHRLGFPEQGLFSFRIVFPESGLVSVEDCWPVAAHREPAAKSFGVLGTSKMNLLCCHGVDGPVVGLDLRRGGLFRISKNPETFAHAATIYRRSSTSAKKMKRWLSDHDEISLKKGSFWDELIGELEEYEM